MLPVELLYGQAPLVEIGRGACDTCSLCTPRACVQLSPRAAIAQHLGEARHGTAWTRTPFGAFAAAFPGVVATFFIADVSTLAGATMWLALGAAASWLSVSGTVALLRPRWNVAVLAIGFVAIALWTWFALPGVAEVWGWSGGAGALRTAGGTLAVVWFVRGLPHDGPREHRPATRFS